jgi:hypothetical protein
MFECGNILKLSKGPMYDAFSSINDNNITVLKETKSNHYE